MKAIVVVVMFFFSVIANATEEFKLKFSDPTQIEFNAVDWELISVEQNYDFYLAKNTTVRNGSAKIHSLVDFHDLQNNENTPAIGPVKKIFTFGIIDCERGIFYMLNDFYTSETHQIVYSHNYAFGEFRVELLTPGTPRNIAYIKACNKDA